MLKSFDGENDLEFAARGGEKALVTLRIVYPAGKIKSGPEIYNKGAAGWFRGKTGMGTKKLSNGNEM